MHGPMQLLHLLLLQHQWRWWLRGVVGEGGVVAGRAIILNLFAIPVFSL